MDDMNLVELVQQFADDEKCRAYIEALRWPKGVTCPRCKCEKVYSILKRDQFVCDSCSYNSAQPLERYSMTLTCRCGSGFSLPI